MRRRMMKSKIHRATVTDADLHYVGSVTLDPDLMDAADLLEFEQVAVVDIDNGARLETYVIAGDRARERLPQRRGRPAWSTRVIKVIVISYADYDDAELAQLRAPIVHVDTGNRPVDEALAKRARPGERYYRRDRRRCEADLDAIGVRFADTTHWSRTSGRCRISTCWCSAAGWPGCPPRCGPPRSTACASACSPRASSTRRRPAGRRAASPRCSAGRPRLDRPAPGRHARRRCGAVRRGRRAGARRRGARPGQRAHRAGRDLRPRRATVGSSWPARAGTPRPVSSMPAARRRAWRSSGPWSKRCATTAAALHEHWFALDLIVDGGRCRGVARPRRQTAPAPRSRAAHVLVATGGAGQLFAVTTNPTEATGDGVAMALRAGVAVADVEFVQFHPTALHHPRCPGRC